MAKYSNVVEYNIVTDVDTSGIIKLQNELTKLKQSLKFDKTGFSQLGFDDAKIDKSIHKINQLQTAITAAFNPKIGTIDLSKLNTSLQKEHTSLQMIVKDWEQMGTRGTMAISNLSNALLSMNKGSMNVNTTLSKIANTFGNTVRWGITASIFQEMMSSVQGAVSYMKDLDESLTQIQMVTNSSKENMRELAQYANNAAQALGSTTVDYTNAVKVFVQEGFSESESKQYANLSTKLANVSEQSTAVTSDQITAFRNAFQLDYEQTVAAMDKVANVANNTASNVNELMTASQRAASVAQAVGSSQDSFLAAIATIESVTRQSAEEIGNGLKTIYQRFADIKVSGKTEDGVDYGQYANALKQIGVDVLDATGEFKGMDQILKETQEVWSSLSDTMKVAVGEKVAGKFQYNRFAALMNNQAYYEKALAATGAGSEGMMDQMNEIYIDSIEGRLNTLQAAGEQVMSTLFDQDNIEPIIEQVTELVNGLNSMVEAAGGLNGVVQVLGATMLRAFSTQIAGTISNMATAISTVAANSRNANQLQTTAQLVGLSNYGQVKNENSTTGKLVAGVANNYSSLSDKTQERIRDLSQQIVGLEEQKINIFKEQQGFFNNINASATEEKVLIEQQLQSLGQQIKLLQEKEKIGTIKTQEQDELVLLREQAQQLGVVRRTYNEIAKACNEYASAIAQGVPVTQEMVTQIERWKQQASGLGINIAELIELTEQLDIAEGNLSIGKKMVDDTIQAANFEARINNIVKAISNITSVAFGFSMLHDAFETLTDDSATLEDRLNAIVINGAMGITMLLPGLTALITQTKAYIISIVAETNEMAKETVVQNLNNLSRSTSIKIILASIAAKIQSTAAIIAETAALVAQRIAVLALSHPVAALAIGISGLAIGIAAVTKAWIDNFGALAQANQKYEQQNELLKETKRNFEDVKEEVESLKTSLDGIKDSQNTLADLKEGTDEWKEAVHKLNNEILTLLQTYPELAKYVKNENGVLTIDENKTNDFYQQQLDKMNHVGDVNSIQQINTLDARNNKLIEEYSSQHNISSDIIRDALSNNTIEIANREDLTDSFAELKMSVESNNAAIETLTSSIGLLDNDFTDYSKNVKISDQKALNSLVDRIGQGTDYGEKYDDERLLGAISELLGQEITSSKDTGGLFGDSLEITTKSGEIIEHSSAEWQQLLMDNEKVLLLTSEKLEENKKIYEALGAEWDTEKNKPRTELSEDNQAALNAFLNDDSFKQEIKSLNESFNLGIDSTEKFAEAIKNGTINVEGLSGALKELETKTVDLTTNINGNAFTNRVDISSDEDAMKKLLDDTGVDETTFNRMSRKTYEEEGGYYDVTRESLEEEINKEKQALEQLITKKQEDGIVTEQESKEIKQETDEVEKLNSKLEGLDDAAKDTTAMILRMNNGVVKLRENFEDISEVLSDDTLEGTIEWYEALDKLDQGLSEVLNIDAGTLSDTFIESGEALDYARRMAEGDMSAIDDLRMAAADDIVQNLAIQVDPTEDVDAIRTELMGELDRLQADISSGAITVTTDLDTHPFVQKLNEMLEAGQISAEQASNVLSSIGMDAEIKHATGEGIVNEVQYEAIPDIGSIEFDGMFGPMSIPVPSLRIIPHVVPKKQEVDYPYLQGAHYTGSGVQTAGAAARNPSFGNQGGGKSSSPKKGSGGKGKNTKPKDYKTSEWDYLTDITNDLNRASAAMEKLTKLEDRLYGKDKISNLKKLKKDYAGYIDLLQQEGKIAERHAKRLRTRKKDENGNLTVKGLADKVGMKLKYDKEGNIENGRKIEIELLDRANKATEQYNKHRNEEDPSRYEDAMEKANKDYSDFLKAYSEYENTLSKIEEAEAQAQEYREKLQDAADEIVDAIQEGIEGIKEALENQRKFDKTVSDWRNNTSNADLLNNEIEYYQTGLANFFSNQVGNMSNFDREFKNLQKRMIDAEEILNAGTEDADKKKLSQVEALNNLKEVTEALVKDIETAIENYNGLIDVISEASEKMDELIDERLEAYDNIVDTIDSRLDQLGLLFGDNYKGQADLYSKRIDANMSKLVDINTAIEAKQASIKEIEKLKDENGKLSVKEQEILKKAQDEVTKLQKEQISTETDLLQDISKKLTAQTSDSMKKAINSMFSGNDVEWISQQWEIAARNSNQYLDDYNRAFEIQKLQLKYQDLLNNSQNSSTLIQNRITESMNEQIGYLQNKKKISEDVLAITEYDVRYAEKQLEILQKQIALEEAQNNKSQMRLQRDAAGNYSFVYGADEDSVNQATQALLNAQQEAYNMSKKMYEDTYESAYQAALKTQEMVVSIATDASLSVAERSERIQQVLNSLNDYMVNSSSELGEISINLYNDFIEAEALISDENLGHLTETFDTIRQLSSQVHSGMEQDIGQYTDKTMSSWDAIEARNQLGWGNIDQTTEDRLERIKKYTGDGWEQIGVSISAKLSEISQQTDDSFINSEGSIVNIIGAALGTINETFEDMKTNSISSVEDIQEAIKTAKEEAVGTDGSGGYFAEYQSGIVEALSICGDSYDNFIEYSLKEANTATEELKGTTKDFNDGLNTLKETIGVATDKATAWKDIITQATTESQNFINKAYEMEAQLSNIAYQAADAADQLERVKENSDIDVSIDYTTTYTTYHNDVYSSSGGGGGGSSGGGYNGGYSGSSGTTSNNSSTYTPTHYSVHDDHGNMLYRTTSQTDAYNYLNNHPSRDKVGWKVKIGKWDTGGYTGVWTDQGIDEKHGKLAILHQKELVLNAHDTENMLSAVEVVRDIMSGINSSTSLGKIINQNNPTDTIEQRVEIQATFPGVTEAIEIKQALEQLANNAYQLANRYKY